MARPTIAQRVEILEREFFEIKTDMSNVKTTLRAVEENSQEILAFLTATKGVGAFAKKHGPRAIAFATGVLVSTGVLSGEIGILVKTLFGV